MKKYQCFYLNFFQFLEVKFMYIFKKACFRDEVIYSIYLDR